MFCFEFLAFSSKSTRNTASLWSFFDLGQRGQRRNAAFCGVLRHNSSLRIDIKSQFHYTKNLLMAVSKWFTECQKWIVQYNKWSMFWAHCPIFEPLSHCRLLVWAPYFFKSAAMLSRDSCHRLQRVATAMHEQSQSEMRCSDVQSNFSDWLLQNSGVAAETNVSTVACQEFIRPLAASTVLETIQVCSLESVKRWAGKRVRVDPLQCYHLSLCIPLHADGSMPNDMK